MPDLTVTLFIFALSFYVQEAISEKPNIMRAAVFLVGAIEACVCMAF